MKLCLNYRAKWEKHSNPNNPLIQDAVVSHLDFQKYINQNFYHLRLEMKKISKTAIPKKNNVCIDK